MGFCFEECYRPIPHKNPYQQKNSQNQKARPHGLFQKSIRRKAKHYVESMERTTEPVMFSALREKETIDPQRDRRHGRLLFQKTHYSCSGDIEESYITSYIAGTSFLHRSKEKTLRMSQTSPQNHSIDLTWTDCGLGNVEDNHILARSGSSNSRGPCRNPKRDIATSKGVIGTNDLDTLALHASVSARGEKGET